MTAPAFRLMSCGIVFGMVFPYASGPAVPLFIQSGKVAGFSTTIMAVERWILNVDAMDGLRVTDFVTAVGTTMGTSLETAIRLLEWAIDNRADAATMPPHAMKEIADAVAASPALQAFDKRAKEDLDERQRNEQIVKAIGLFPL